VPASKFAVRNEPANPAIANPSAWIAAHGANAANQMCGLAGYQQAYDKEKLVKLYGNKKTYLDRVRKDLDELEKTGWSLPLYRDMILEDAAKVSF
jgi:Alpha/beta hydrolase domain